MSSTNYVVSYINVSGSDVEIRKFVDFLESNSKKSCVKYIWEYGCGFSFEWFVPCKVRNLLELYDQLYLLRTHYNLLKCFNFDTFKRTRAKKKLKFVNGLLENLCELLKLECGEDLLRQQNSSGVTYAFPAWKAWNESKWGSKYDCVSFDKAVRYNYSRVEMRIESVDCVPLPVIQAMSCMFSELTFKIVYRPGLIVGDKVYGRSCLDIVFKNGIVVR